MTTLATLPPPDLREPIHLSKGKVGMTCLIITESCFFLTFIVAYLFYIGKDSAQGIAGPTPQESLGLGLVLVNTVFLLSSSIWVVLAVKSLAKGRRGLFLFWMGLTVVCGLEFIVGTGYEWYGLIANDGLMIDTNLFGTTFYSLVGFHLFHVCIGVIGLSIAFFSGLFGWIGEQHVDTVDVFTWYWHFVDGIWIFVFSTVYLIGFFG
jgi:cytochrome c oxidase subunit 3/cytochrome o ubiquinol oxidase subunit 3